LAKALQHCQFATLIARGAGAVR